MALTFEWDAQKNAANQQKHSHREVRLLLLGRSAQNRLLAVLFTDRGDELIRIISARPASPRERRKYEEDFR